MAVTKDQLIKQWIQYLKSNQIVELQPDPAGKLIYRKNPTEEDLFQFLQKTFSDDEIKRAFVNAKKSAAAKTKKVPEGLESENPCWKGYHPVGTKKKNGKTVPNCVPNTKESIDEDFTDLQRSVDEQFVSRVFSAIIRIQTSDLKQQQQLATDQRKKAALDKIRSMIQSMSASQRTSLLAALKSPVPSQSVPESFSISYDNSLLVQKWKEYGYPRTTGSLSSFLYEAGYSFRDIKNALGSFIKGKQPATDIEEPDNTQAIARIVKVVKDLGISQEVINMLEQDFKVQESIIDFMDIKSILEHMSTKERTGYLRLVEKERLGKNRKI